MLLSEYGAVGGITKNLPRLTGPNRVFKSVEEVGIVEGRGREEEGLGWIDAVLCWEGNKVEELQ